MRVQGEVERALRVGSKVLDLGPMTCAQEP